MTDNFNCALSDPAGWGGVRGADRVERGGRGVAIHRAKKRAHRRAPTPRPTDQAAARRTEPASPPAAGQRAAGADDAPARHSPRQQRILQLSFEGASVHEIAHELRLPAERISDEKYKAIHKLREHLGIEA